MMKNRKTCVDVAIGAYGKPYQTAAPLLALMKHSGQRINNVVIDLEKTRKDTRLYGNRSAFGTYARLEARVKWLADMNNMGHIFLHFDFDDHAIHGWVSPINAGHNVLFNMDLHHHEESVAKEV